MQSRPDGTRESRRIWLLAAAALALAAVACGTTPTAEPGSFETSVAETVQADMAAAESAEPTPTDAPPTQPAEDTPTPSPTTPPASDTPPPPTDAPPAPTQAPVPCEIPIAPEFEAPLEAAPNALAALGCPTGERQHSSAAEQPFERGRMFWHHGTGMIHILYDDGSYQVVEDQYVEGEPEDACPDAGNAPDGLFKPERGFNWHWCNTPGVREGLGWAVQPEAGYEGVWQEFEGGHAVQGRGELVYVFYQDGTWEQID